MIWPMLKRPVRTTVRIWKWRHFRTSLFATTDECKANANYPLAGGSEYKKSTFSDLDRVCLSPYLVTHEFGLLIPSQSGIPPSYQGLVDRR